MRVKIRYPTGSSPPYVLTIPDSEPLSGLISQIKGNGKLEGPIEIKHGFPPKIFDFTSFPEDTPLDKLPFKLDGDQLTVSESENATKVKASPPPPPVAPAAPVPEIKAPKAPTTTAPKPSNTAAKDDPPDVLIHGRGTVVLRVMEDDNSCMFRAVSYVCANSVYAVEELRQLIASTIQDDPITYNEAVLGSKIDEYCSWITMDSSWGGGIELSILANFFEIEIISIDVSTGSIIRFNEGRPKFCIVVYSGIHYDALALSPITAFSFQSAPDKDERIFDRGDDQVIQSASELVAKLKKKKYFTDTKHFTLKCAVCGSAFIGQKQASEHAKTTGHTDFGEY